MSQRFFLFRIFRCLVSVQPRCSNCPVDLAWRCAAPTADGRKKFDSLWPTLRECRSIPVFTSQECLPQSLSIAINVSDDRMAQRANRSLPDGMETRTFLHRLLLAIDAPALCGRCHESSLDCPACDFCFIGARRTKTLVSGASIRAGSRRVGNIDVALLAANCRLNIGALRHRES